MSWSKEVFSRALFTFGIDFKMVSVDKLPDIGEERIIYNLGDGSVYVWDEFDGKPQYIMWVSNRKCPHCGHKI